MNGVSSVYGLEEFELNVPDVELLEHRGAAAEEPTSPLGSVIPRYDRAVKVDKLSVSFEPGLGDAVRAAARQSGGGLSRWLAEAAAAKLRAEALADYLDSWEAEHGELTADELAQAAAELALPNPATTEPAA